jgi:hypothetical protein
VDVVPNVGPISGARPSRRRVLRQLPRLVRRRRRRRLTLVAVVVAVLAFAATAHAGVDDAAANADPQAPPPVAAAPAAPAAADPAPAAMTTAATNEVETVVSPQYQAENSPDSASAEADAAPAPADQLPAAHLVSESSTSAQPQTEQAAASRLLIPHVESPPVRRTVPDSRPRAAPPSPHRPRVVAERLREAWYQQHNSQYQFTSSFTIHASHHFAIEPDISAAKVAVVAHIRTKIQRQIRRSVPATTATRRSAQDLLESAPCTDLASVARADAASCAATQGRYHDVQTRYQPRPTEPEATSNVVSRLDQAARQLAIRGTAVGPSPDPRPADAATGRPKDSTSVGASRPFLPLALAGAVARTLSPAVVPHPPALLTRARPAARLASGFAARVARSLRASLLPRLDAIGRPGDLRAPNLRGGHLADTRRLLQIGIALGIAYLVFLTFWFWGTRRRNRGLRGGARF